ncbi:arginine--tRNA ligase, partial [Candidatus Saccharibacteria bacterium]|nr:arginine--tRNA ligase [Candidatus Saccharibacteria bacterium]
MRDDMTRKIQSLVAKLFNVDTDVELSRPDEQFGDYATNVALKLAKQLNKNPREVAQQIADALVQHVGGVASAEVAGPGFINLRLTDSILLDVAEVPLARPYDGQTVVTEYSDPNPFKVLHAGHLYTSIVGDAMSNLLELAGATVHRVNFGGDVGLHVGKTLWGILKELGGVHPEKLADVSVDKRADWMAARYVTGTQAYENDEAAKAEITELNKNVYEFHSTDDHESPLAQIYWTCREWSYAYFDEFYARIGTKFEKYYPESQTAPLGLKTVQEHVGTVYAESNGAIVFDGGEYGLHTRVFINSSGLPTYEAKDVGLAIQKWQDYHFDRSVIITGNDIVEYMKVVMKSLEQFAPETVVNTTHMTHGQVKLSGGVKMSSRKGNFLRAVDVLEAAHTASRAAGNDSETISLGAVKYAFLKQRVGGDIVYEPDESVSLQGNSGPYLQYAHARACSILTKGANAARPHMLQPAERQLLTKI